MVLDAQGHTVGICLVFGEDLMAEKHNGGQAYTMSQRVTRDSKLAL